MILEHLIIIFIFLTNLTNFTNSEIRYVEIKEGTTLILKSDIDLVEYDAIVWFRVNSDGADEMALASIVNQVVKVWETPKEKRIKMMKENNRITFHLENVDSSDEGFYRFERLPIDHNDFVYKVSVTLSNERSTGSSEKVLLPLIICVTVVLVVLIIALTIICFLKSKRQMPIQEDSESNTSNTFQRTVSPTPTSSGVFSTELSNSNGFSSASSVRMTPVPTYFDEISPSIV